MSAAASESAIKASRFQAEFGIWVFLATEILFFNALFLTFAIDRMRHRDAFLIAARHTDLTYGTINTALLLTSSLTMALAVKVADAGRRKLAVRFLLATIALALCFLAVKGLEYRSDIVKGLTPGHNFALSPPATALFWSLYWVMTGVHAVHVTVGIAILSFLAWSIRKERIELRGGALEAAALYWHFVDIVWIFLYPLLYLGGRAS